MCKVIKVTTRKTTMVWLLNNAKGDVNLHDFWTQTTALKLEHISRLGGGGGRLGRWGVGARGGGGQFLIRCRGNRG